MIYRAGLFDQKLEPAGSLTGVDRWLLPILRYRSVPHHSPETAAPRSVPAARLEEHLTFLVANGWRLVGITDALRILEQDGSCRVVALTFDDALLDFLNAFDLLQRVGARATLYVPTATVGTRVSRWDRGLSRLDWCHLREIAVAGFEIGSQAVSSRPLDACDDATVLAEARDSKREIEDQLGQRVDSFCYPAGRLSPRLRRAVRAAGYSNACMTALRVARSRDDVFGLPRLRVKASATGDRIDGLLRTGSGNAGTSALRIAEPSLRITQQIATRAARAARYMSRRPTDAV
jgi:peptidoglycan/xylan/chitin deacetylase (PgdA/CDA1 family)